MWSIVESGRGAVVGAELVPALAPQDEYRRFRRVRAAFVGAGPRPARPAEGRRWCDRHDPRASPARTGRGPAPTNADRPASARLLLEPQGVEREAVGAVADIADARIAVGERARFGRR